jgi:hypothetical protein
MSYFKMPLAALAALLLASPLTHAQQATTKVKTKSSKTSQSAPLPAPAVAPAGSALAPPPPPAGGPRPGGPGRPGDGGPGRPDGPAPRKGGVQALTDFSGTLTDYTAANDDQVYDAFTLKTSAGTEIVRFPRHLAQALMAAAKAGSQVTVSGFRDTDPEGRTALHLVSLTAGSQTVRDTPPVRPATPPTEESTTVRGTVQRLAQGPNGRTNALVMSDGTLLRLPPAAAEQLAEKLKTGATVAATGTLRAPAPGEVAAKPVRVVRAQTITIDGVQFLVQ